MKNISCTLVLVWCGLLARISEQNVVPLEAAFQGQCEDGNPCAQNCYNIHNEMYECDCNRGYVLSDNGYSCIAPNDTEKQYFDDHTSNNHLSNPSSDSKNSSSPIITSQKKSSPINIHIEVDIDPPKAVTAEDQLSPVELESLGLPSTHVHYSNTGNKPPSEELLAPSDIKVTYSKEGEDAEEQPLRDKLMSSVDSEVLAYDNYQSYNDAVFGLNPEPPRALPSSEGQETREQPPPAEHPPAPAAAAVHHGDLSDRVPPSEVTFEDKIYTLEAMCDLDCGVRGQCLLEKLEKDSLRKRCLCPVGKTGEKCAFDHTLDSGAVHFSGHSWISLPTLTHAYSDLQLSFEFKPEAPDGVLLLTGETGDMTGDYLALLLRDGHVELRLDCGTGPGIVITESKVHLGRWNRLTVFRHDWGVWLQLNGGKHQEGRSQGLFSRITFAQPVQLGGTSLFLNSEHFLETNKSYQGCIRNLEINNKAYNLNPTDFGGDILSGVDIDECRTDDDDCQTLTCQHHGVCRLEFETKPNNKVSSRAYCECPLGFDGQFCETPVEIQIPSFNGKSSHLIFAGLGQKSPLWNDFELVIRPTEDNGLILYNGDRSNPNGDFVAVFLSQGYIEFAFDAGDGATVVRSSSPLKLNRWHRVRVTRTGLLAEVQVNDRKRVAQLAAGAFTQVILRQSLYLGGVPTFEIVSPYIPVRVPFSGCIQKLMINNQHVDLVHGSQGGINVSPCWSHPCSVQNATAASPCGLMGNCRPIMNDYSCECPLGLTGARCEHSLLANNLFSTETSKQTTRSSTLDNAPAFTGDSFLHYNDEPIAQNIVGNTNTLNLRVKIESANGLLVWTGGDEMSPASDFLLLGIENGFLHFRFNLGNGEGGVIYNDTRIDDGKWHRLRATRIEQTATVRVDNGPIVTGASPGKLRQLNGNGQLFIGGVEDIDQLPVPQFRKGFVGCISELSVGKLFSIDLLNRAKNGQNVDSCRETFDF